MQPSARSFTFRDLLLTLLVLGFIYGQVSKRPWTSPQTSSTVTKSDVFFDGDTAVVLIESSNSSKTSANSHRRRRRRRPDQSPSYEIVVTLLHDNSQNWKHASGDQGKFLMQPEVADIPVTICSPDKLLSKEVFTNGLATMHFRPEADDVFGHILKSKRSGAVTFLPMVNGKHAQEVPGYLTYILHNYDDLPDAVIFLHADPTGHGANILRNIRHVVDNWTPQQIGFLHLNEGAVMCRPGGGQGAWGRFWELLGFDLSRAPVFIKQPCCAQFIVSRDRILLRSKWFYQQLLKLAYDVEESAFQEHYWHIFFGESAILSDDREIQNYFRSNWTKPVHDAVLHNPFPNVPYSEAMKPWYEKSIANPDAYYPKISSNRDETCPPGSMHR